MLGVRQRRLGPATVTYHDGQPRLSLGPKNQTFDFDALALLSRSRCRPKRIARIEATFAGDIVKPG